MVLGKGLIGVLLVFVRFFGTNSRLSRLRKAEGNIKKKEMGGNLAKGRQWTCVAVTHSCSKASNLKGGHQACSP